MSYIESMKARKNFIEKKINEVKGELCMLPAGKLGCQKNGNYYKWVNYKSPKKSDVEYIKKSNRKFAEALANRGYYEAMLKDLKNELKNINCFLEKHASVAFPPGVGYIDKGEEYRKLLQPLLLTENERVKEFLSRKYVGAQHPEKRKFKCRNGLSVRSKSENGIADALYAFGIPFLYEYPLEIEENWKTVVIHPDFYIYDFYNNRIYIWEHFGMMDDPRYVSLVAKKIEQYAAMGFYPGENLIMTFESPGHKLSSGEIEDVIRQYFPWAA